MSKTMKRNTEPLTFFGHKQKKGKRHDINLQSDKLQMIYNHPNGKLWSGDCFMWLNSLPDESVDLIFADPPYNIKKANWDTFEVRKNIFVGQWNGLKKQRGF